VPKLYDNTPQATDLRSTYRSKQLKRELKAEYTS